MLGLCAMLLMQPLGTSTSVNSQDIRPAPVQSPSRDATEAPTGFDNQTNGLTDQSTFEADREVFEEAETIEEGLGPVFIEIFARFMRATKAPPRDAELAMTPDAQAGEQIFQQLGCAICHVPTIITAQPGTVINGGAFTVPEALGDKIIHPFSDFLLHDVGTGDGIVQNGGPGTRNKIRTAPLWGLRTRPQFMHDGLSLTLTDAIVRHAREALDVIDQYWALSTPEKDQLLAFLQSL
jgi:CxxC motif-containing protein (DUF1111 family)